MMKPAVRKVIKAPQDWYEQEIAYYNEFIKEDPSDDDDKPEREEISSGEEEID